jgi:hypothetical protein
VDFFSASVVDAWVKNRAQELPAIGVARNIASRAAANPV